jgi:hypothetical protein
VFEHILVAEQLLGRYPVEGKSVHYINQWGVGARFDSRNSDRRLCFAIRHSSL